MYRLATRYWPQVDLCTPRSAKRYDDLLKLMVISDRMTQDGWLLDQSALQAHRCVASESVLRFTDLFLSITGLSGSVLGSSGSGQTASVREWFLGTSQAPKVATNKETGAAQLNSFALIEYATRYRHRKFGPAAAALYGLRKNKKVLEFIKAYEMFAQKDGRIHFGFNPAGTQTGRWTSATRLRVVEGSQRVTYRANAQQIPSKEPPFDFGQGEEKLTHSLRNCFIADPGCVLIKADYDQLELRLIAYIYGAKRLIEWIEGGLDVHMENAKRLFQLPDEAVKGVGNELWDKARDAAKPTAYAVSYQMHDEEREGRYPKLHETLSKIFPGITEQAVGKIAEAFFTLHPEIKQGQKRAAEEIKQIGYGTLPIDGRRLYYPPTTRGINQHLNFFMQATGAALVNRATIELGGKEFTIRAQVHDELVLQASESDAQTVALATEEAMSRPARLGAVESGIPCVAQVGKDWVHTKKLDKCLDQ